MVMKIKILSYVKRFYSKIGEIYGTTVVVLV